MALFKPDAPTPPNPYQTAAAQTGTNVATGVANAFLNNVNQNTPQGSLSYDVTGNYDWTDPSTNTKYSLPRFTANQTLSPQQEAINNNNQSAQINLSNIAKNQSWNIGQLLDTPFNPNQWAPQAGDPSSITGLPKAATSYDTGGEIQRTFGDAGDITRSYGAGDFSQDRQNVEDSLMARMNPQLARERSNVEQRLADQGIRYGSPAYAAAMDDYNRQATDARFAAVGQAGQEQQRMMDMAAQQAGFQNAAQQQAYDQAQGRGSFANAAQAQQNAQNAALAGFGNAGLAQQLGQAQSGFNAMNTDRARSMQEQYQQRNQPLNEITALMSGSQIQAPSWANTPQNQIATTDFAGIMNANAQLQSQNYQTAQSAWNSTMGGILGAAGAVGGGWARSDRDVKENIVPMGTVFAADEDGERKQLPISEWSYKGDPARHVGPMAQDVVKVDRGAVKSIGGVKHINTRKVMGSILRAA